MAKRKKKKRPQTRPAPAAQEQAADPGAPPQKTGPSKPAAGGAPVERKARREMARKEREKTLKRYQRRQIIRRALIAGLVVGVVVLIVGFYMKASKTTSTSNPEVAALVAKAPAAAKAAGCGPVSNVGPYQPETDDHQHITGTPPNLSTYPSVPPASGPHNPVPIKAGVYDKPPDVYEMIHGLEHGGVEFWYSPDVAKSLEITAMTTFVKKNQDHVAMAPYDYPGNGDSSALPAGKHFALVSWHFVQLCDKVPGVPVAAAFMASYRSPTLGGGPYKGEATELGAAM